MEGEVVDRTFRIAVHKIRKIKEDYEADVQIVDGVGATVGGLRLPGSERPDFGCRCPRVQSSGDASMRLTCFPY